VATTGQEHQIDVISFWPIIPITSSFNANDETDLSMIQARPTRIVIIGGSFAGLSVAKKLDRQAKRYNLHITLIDPREDLFCNVAFLRACLIDIGRLCFLNPDQAFTSGRVHRCRTRVVHLEKYHVVLEPWSKERLQQYYNAESTQSTNHASTMEPPPTTLPFDYAVIAAGSQYSSPMKFSTESVEEAIQEQSRVRAAIGRSNRILIVGGGPSGVELATEIKHYHPDKSVTLVHYARRLIQSEAVRQKLRLRVEKTLRKMGVNLRLNECVLLTEDQRMRGWIEGTRHYTTNHGNFIETDLLVSIALYLMLAKQSFTNSCFCFVFI
jgi:NADH dehydrogenase FAD-containing subunit